MFEKCDGGCAGLVEEETLHTCPFAVEIGDDAETLCNCCADCERNCAWEI